MVTMPHIGRILKNVSLKECFFCLFWEGSSGETLSCSHLLWELSWEARLYFYLIALRHAHLQQQLTIRLKHAPRWGPAMLWCLFLFYFNVFFRESLLISKQTCPDPKAVSGLKSITWGSWVFHHPTLSLYVGILSWPVASRSLKECIDFYWTFTLLTFKTSSYHH